MRKSKITPGNYIEKAAKVDFGKLPAKFKETHGWAKKVIELKAYTKPGPIKEALEAYLSEFDMQVLKLGIADEVEKTKKELDIKTATTALKMRHQAKEDTAKATAKKDGPTVHYCTEGDTIYIDTPFVQNSQSAIPHTELKHYGGGDFGLTGAVTMNFVRTEKKLPGFEGRTHKYSGDKIEFGRLLTGMKAKGIKVVDTKAKKETAPAKAKAKAKKPAPGAKKKPKVTEAQKKKAKADLEKMKGEAEVGKFKKLKRDEILTIAQRFEATRGLLARAIDEGSDNKNRLTPTPENLVRWMKNPGKFDLIGVDTFKKGDATANLQINKDIFWKRLLKGK